MESHPDSALHLLRRLNTHRLYTPSNKAYYALLMSQALDKNELKVESDSNIKVATGYYSSQEPERAAYAWFYHARIDQNRGNADEQVVNLMKAQEYARLTNNSNLKGLIYGDKANMYASQRQFDSMIHYNRMSFHCFQRTHDIRNSVISLINLGYGYLYKSKYDSAILNYRLAGKLSLSLHDTIILSTVYRSIGSAYYQKKQYREALYYYQLAPVTGIEMYDSNKWYLMAKVYVRSGKTDSARFYMNLITGMHDLAPDYYKQWQSIYEKEGNLKAALHFANKINLVKDSINERKLSVSFAGLEKKYKYQGLQLENEHLNIINKQKSLFLLFSLFVLSIFAITVLFYRLNVNKKQLTSQNELLAKEIALAQNEKEKFEKEKENNILLEKQLKLQAILLLNIEQHRMNSIKRPGLWKNGLNEIKSDQNTPFYEELIACMDLEYHDISHRLLKDFTTLTTRDILVCCLLLAGFDTGMIATILDVKLESVTKHRYRLRVKLQLQSSVHLVDYLRLY